MTESGHHPRFDDDLVGLDPDDPEAQAFARHLDRMEHCRPGFTVEGTLHNVAEFADSSTRVGGLRWWIAATIVVLLVLGVIVASWDIIVRAVEWLAE